MEAPYFSKGGYVLLKDAFKEYRKETFITSAFSFVCSLILLAILISIYGLDVSAQEVSGNDSSSGSNIPWSYDSDETDTIFNIYNFEYDGPYLNFEGSGLSNSSFDNKYYRNLYANFTSYTLNGTIPTSWVYNGDTYNISDYPYFVIVSSVFNSSQCFIFVSTDNNFSVANIPFFKTNESLISSPDAFVFPLSGNMFIGRTNPGSDFIELTNDNVTETVFSENYYVYRSNGVNYGKPILSNSNIPFSLLHVHSENGHSNLIEEGQIEVNYLLGDLIEDGVFPDPNDGTNDNQNGSNENNMYLDSADFKFTIPSYSYDGTQTFNDAYDLGMQNMRYSNNWGKGIIDFDFNPNQYQIEHASEFELYFSFFVLSRFDGSMTPFEQSGNSLFLKWKSCSVNTAQLDIIKDMDVAINNSNRVSFNVSDIFSDSNISGLNNPDNIISGASVNGSYDRWISGQRELKSIVYKDDNNNGWKIYCSVYVRSKTQSTNLFSGKYSEEYSFITKKSTTSSNDITNNNNPYIPSDDDDSNPSNQQPNTSTNSSSGGNTLINNDNDNINIKYPDYSDEFNSVKDELLVDDNDNTGLVNKFHNLTDDNEWITVFNTYLSAVPSGIWDALVTTLEIVLGIIASAFLFKILLHML